MGVGSVSGVGTSTATATGMGAGVGGWMGGVSADALWDCQSLVEEWDWKMGLVSLLMTCVM